MSVDAQAHAEQTRTLASGTRWLTASTVVVGVVNYLFALLLTRVLDVDQYQVFAAAQALLLVIGTIAGASVPWVVARWLATAGDDRNQRRKVVWFAIKANIGQGLVGGVVVGLVSLGFAEGHVAALVGASAAMIFLAATAVGWLQGEARFQAIAGLRITEVVLKAVGGMVLAVLGLGAAGALSGFGLGAFVVLVLGLWIMREDLRPTTGLPGTTGLWGSAGGVVGVQGLVAVLASLDHVLVALLPTEASAAASYQVSMILARVPLFIAGAVSMAVFPLLSRPGVRFGDLVRNAVRLYSAVVAPLVVGLVTVPTPIIAAMFPGEYGFVGALLPFTAVTGASIGIVTLLATFFQAEEAYALSVRAQLTGIAAYVVAMVLGFAVGGIYGFAIGSVMGSLVAALLLLRRGIARWPGGVYLPWASLLWAAVLASLLIALRPWPVIWLVAAVPLLGGSALFAFASRGEREPLPTHRPLRILHLGFEDHARPGSGGGALRTHEVNRRLAVEHEITVLASTWPGAEDRVEEGIRYVHIGRPWGYVGSLLTYFIALPFATWRHREVDLVIEDFAAPISSTLAALWSPRPVVSMVQWLNAREKSRQYKLPFFLIELLGVRLQDRYVTVSQGIAERLREANPDASVWVVPNGVDRNELDREPSVGRDIVFLGRLENAQKGVELLVEAFAMVADRTDARLLLAGDGPDRSELERRIRGHGLEERIEFVGRVAGREKAELLGTAAVVAMPSRFETFGIVAVEAQAAGTPVIAFDIPCLREVVPAESGLLVPAFDVERFAAGLLELLEDRQRLQVMGVAGRAFAARYDWDQIARDQEAAYRAASLPGAP